MVIDKRILKTRKNIKTAFMQLILENELHKITISDLTEKAMINRSTFYLHYGSVSEVMKDIESEIEKQISACFSNFKVSDICGSTFTIFTKLTDALTENQLLKSYILESTVSKNIIIRLKQIFSEIAEKALIESFPALNKTKIEYPLNFAASGIIDCYVKWAHSQDKDIPLNELINVVSTLTKYVLEYINI